MLTTTRSPPWTGRHHRFTAMTSVSAASSSQSAATAPSITEPQLRRRRLVSLHHHTARPDLAHLPIAPAAARGRKSRDTTDDTRIIAQRRGERSLQKFPDVRPGAPAPAAATQKHTNAMTIPFHHRETAIARVPQATTTGATDTELSCPSVYLCRRAAPRGPSEGPCNTRLDTGRLARGAQPTGHPPAAS